MPAGQLFLTNHPPYPQKANRLLRRFYNVNYARQFNGSVTVARRPGETPIHLKENPGHPDNMYNQILPLVFGHSNQLSDIFSSYVHFSSVSTDYMKVQSFENYICNCDRSVNQSI